MFKQDQYRIHLTVVSTSTETINTKQKDLRYIVGILFGSQSKNLVSNKHVRNVSFLTKMPITFEGQRKYHYKKKEFSCIRQCFHILPCLMCFLLIDISSSI